MKLFKTATLSLAALAMTATVSMADTLDDTKKKGYLSCGLNTGLAGFAAPDTDGVWKGIDVDFCKAVSAAVLGDASKVKYAHLNAKERFTALQSGEIDVLARNTTWTATRDTSLGLNFIGANYYDGQGFLVSKKLGVKSAKELDGAAFCIQAGTTTELNLTDYFKANKMEYTPVTYDTAAQVIEGFKAGRCDVVTSDASQLYALRTQLKDPSSAFVLPEIISKEPLGPVVRQGDDKWFNIVRWTHIAMLNAEELGVNSQNVDQMLNSSNPSIQRLLGVSGKIGEQMGLDAKWAYNIIKQVGNYGEVFERNVGKGSPLQIDRGLNKLWKDGGLQYGAPIR
ncbi:amino acid ABC transporter substrate-binding protein [Halarcobacter bivalviorum]|uniref:Amino acid ABC transporter substrate-binding protein n=1 Tax=Halarcobacter bivalviorum TaxID=663364 RepID=A0AAX2A8X1_9BACT|nr:amino acid ABC transporter substrate-binding protein [Halarcobacter bivalviorum]AXH13104.1 amino acid ABC transporter, periplasmic amino acid-binding protein [Halarcobacter bivalviorum]RXK04152.1 amino acid ABC transporter substrate-binding protein [Halarcobacter bivalviorum]RXK10280.1 amino acid ABC transporter substrate-binding protein [Halarcobacter bivalviorum]